MSAAGDLDAGLDAGLETYPRTELVALALGPLVLAIPTGAAGISVIGIVIVGSALALRWGS